MDWSVWTVISVQAANTVRFFGFFANQVSFFYHQLCATAIILVHTDDTDQQTYDLTTETDANYDYII